MATTLAEYSKLSNDVVLQGIIETVIYESSTLERLPFVSVSGNALTYNRETTVGGAAFYDVGDTWTEGTPTFTQATATLKILGGDADVDEYIKRTRSDINDVEADIIAFKSRDVAHKFDSTFVNGSDSTDPKSFDGLVQLINADTVGGQYQETGTNGAALTLDFLDKLIDAVKPGTPDALMMTKASRRKIRSLARASGSGLMESDRNEWGRMFERYGGIPIVINDWISDVEEHGSSGALCTSIYAMKLDGTGLCGLTNGWIEHIDVGQLETKDASRHRIRWYCGLALFNTYAAARLGGILN